MINFFTQKNKFKKCLLFILIAFCYSNIVSAQSCTPAFTHACPGTNLYEYISNVSSAAVSNPSGCVGDPNYTDYSGSITFDATTGNSFGISVEVTFAWAEDNIGVFVDYNLDGDFLDVGETVIEAVSGAFPNANLGNTTETYSGSFFIAPSVLAGVYPMRVVLYYNQASPLDPCFTGNIYGEGEDYSLNIQAGSGCFGVGNFISSQTLTTALVSWSTSPPSVEYLVRYKLQSDPTSVPTWAIPSIVTDTFINLSGLDTCSAYQIEVRTNCGLGDSSLWSVSYLFNTNCCLDQTDGATALEFEICGDDINGGCGTGGGYEPINFGDVIGGTASSDGVFAVDEDWYEIVVPQDTFLTISLFAAFESDLTLYDGNAGCTFTTIDNNSSFGACQIVTLSASVAAGTYWIVAAPATFTFVDNACGSGNNAYQLSLTASAPPPPPANDDCLGATVLIQDVTCNYVTSNVANATQSLVACNFGTANDDVWFSFVATTTDPIISVQGSAGFDAVFDVYDACGGLSIAGCIDNTGTGGEETTQATGLTIGNTYYIRVYDYFTGFPGTTDFQICVSAPFQYCQPTVAICDEFISNVTLGASSNPTDCTVGGYTDYSSSVSFDVTAGSCNTMTVVVGPPFYTNDGISIFVDWNNDLDFIDAGEELFTQTNTTDGIFNALLNISGSQTPGAYRMRVRLYFNTGFGDPCISSTFGEVEDYTLNVIAGGTCIAPGALTFSNQLTNSIQLNWGASGTAVSYNVRYKLSTDPTSVATWATPTVVTAPTNFINITGLDSCSQYEFQVQSDCGAGDTSSYSCSSFFGTACCVELNANANHIEAEVCQDDANGGCNMTVPTFEPSAIGDSISGTVWSDGNTVDLDWYQITVPIDTQIVLTLQAGFESRLILADSSNCAAVDLSNIQLSNGDCETITLTANVGAGTYWVIAGVSYNTFGVQYPCGGGLNNYNLTIDAIAPASVPANDSCQFATEVFCGDSIVGSTNFATPDAGLPFCTVTPAANGVWYKIIGNGQIVTASLCDGTTYDSQVNVYSGSCGNFTCVSGNDDGCGGFGVPSTTSFLSTQDSTYYIYVNGPGTGFNGNFTLKIICSDPPVNDLCTGALPIVCNDVVTGSTSIATIDNDAVAIGLCGTTPAAPGVWYSFIGDGSAVTLSLCNTGTDYDTKINVYTGTCGGLICNGGNDDDFNCGAFGPSTFTFTSIQDTVYYILVNGYNNNIGNFEMTVVCVAPPTNDLACDALPLTFGVNGPFNTESASTEVGEVSPPATGCQTTDGWCNSNITNTLWFSFVAPASGHISLNSPDYDTQLALWAADSCQQLTNGTATLVNANDDDPNGIVFGSSYFESSCLTPGSTYYVQFDPYTSPGASSEIILTDLGPLADASFTGLADSYSSCDAVVTLVPVTSGGTFAGSGVSGDQFDPSVAGVGTHIISYTVGACSITFDTTTVSGITLTTADTQPSCGLNNGAIDLTITGGAGGNIISWTGGTVSSNEDLTALSPGTYDVLVTDASTCTASTSVTLNPSTGATVFGSPIDASCGSDNGTIDITATGNGALTYAWDNSATTEDLANLSGGLFCVTVTDANSCTASDCYLLVSGPAVTLAESHVNVGCGDLGSINLTVTDGTSPYTYSWSGPSGYTSTSEDINNLDAGSYTVTVTDVTLCTSSVSVVISGGGGGALNVIVTSVGPINSCHQAFNVTLTATTLPDVSYTFRRGILGQGSPIVQSGSDNSFQPNTPGANFYYVIATDTVSGCTDTSNSVLVTLSTFDQPTVLVGTCTGNQIPLTSSVTGPNLSYQWIVDLTDINGATSSTYNALAVGSYRVRVTDSCGVSKTSVPNHFDNGCFTTGINDIEIGADGSGLNVYPNPSEGNFNVEVVIPGNAYEVANIQVLNVLGQVVLTAPITFTNGYAKTNLELMNKVSAGIYQISIKTENSELVKKIVINK